MLRQLLFGGLVSICNIAVHALMMTIVVRAAQAMGEKRFIWPSLRLPGIMIATAIVLMTAHTAEVLIWALGYLIVEAAPADANAVYFAFVNYTTLGYGDVVPVPDWRLLGPMTAMNGVLLFGWSTAVIFEVLRNALRR